MKICHITTGLTDGGAEGVLYRLVCHDGPERHHVVSLMDEGKYGPLLRRVGARVTCLNMPRGRLRLTGLWRLWRLLGVERPQVVQTWMYHGDFIGGTIARLAGVRRVCWGIRTSTLEPGKSSRSTIWIARFNARLSHWVPQVIICCSEKARVVHAALNYAADKMVVIPNGYDLAQFCPDLGARERLRREWQIPDDTFVIGMVGRLDPQKDHENLLAALATLKLRGVPFLGVLVGNGLVPDNPSIARLISAYGLDDNVRLLGQRGDIPAVMNALDLHVLSSAFGEAFPNVLAEAMACGTPCVTTHVGDAAEIVGETGWVVPPRDADALAEAIRVARAQWATAQWGSRQRAARRRVAERFSLEQMIEAYRAVWRSTVEAHRREH